MATRPIGGFTRREHPVTGMRPTVRFALAVALTACWVGFGVWVSGPWRDELDRAVGPVLAWLIPLVLAYIPGLVVGFMASTLIVSPYHGLALDPPAGPWPKGEWPAVTAVVAAWNEEQAIEATLERLAATTYPGRLEVVLADNNSTDRTAEVAEAAARRLGLEYRRVFEPQPGKFHALNRALETIETPLVVTVDADTYVYPAALGYLVARVTEDPQDEHVCACAGAIIVENARTNFLTRMQQWDYRLGINGIKRMQAAYNSALVAQGAFSVYWTEDVQAVGGWPDAIGEDIVLTWTMMDRRGIVLYEPLALASTTVPEQLGHFMRQRSRWARGMFEGLRANPPHRQPRVIAKLVAGIDYLVPFLDLGYLCFWVPGLILAILGYPLILSWWSMLLIPISLAIYHALSRWQEHHVFRAHQIELPPDRRGFWGYVLLYHALSSTASVRGYAQYIAGANRRWK